MHIVDTGMLQSSRYEPPSKVGHNRSVGLKGTCNWETVKRLKKRPEVYVCNLFMDLLR